MVRTHKNDGQRRKQVRVRLRPNLVLTAQQSDGPPTYVVKDPVTLQYFRLDEGQRFVVGLMDGNHTLEEIQRAYEERFRPERLTLEELEAFTAQLLDGGLVQNESPLASALLFERAEKQRRDTLRATLLNFLCIKVPLGDPDRLLGHLAPRVRFLFSVWGALFSVAVLLAALGLIALRWQDFLTRLPNYRDLWTPNSFLYLGLAIALAKLLHELGHGLCCKVHGGEVHEMGALFLVFCPTLYCNVSDSWTLPSRWQRLAVAAAGVYIDLLLAGVATLVWWLTDPAAPLHNLCFALMVFCGLGTLLWNANPLMRFDGYYVLSDLLDIPNLAEASSQALQAALGRWLGLDLVPPSAPTPGRPLFLLLYAVASSAYRLAMTVLVFYSLCIFLKPYKLGIVGFVLAAAGLLVVFGAPVYRFARLLARRGRLPEMKRGRLGLAVGAAVLLLGLFFTVPLPLHVEGRALLLPAPEQVHLLTAPEMGGFVREVLVCDGQAVQAGDVLAVLSNPKLEIKLQVNEADQTLRLRQLAEQTAQLADAGSPGDQVAETVQQTELELQALVREHAALLEERGRLTLRAPCNGIVVGLQPAELKGKWLDKGDEVCRIADPQALRAVLLVEPADQRLIAPASHASIRVHGLGGRSWEGRVADVAQVDARKVPPQLASRAGGEVATEQDPVSRTDRPRQQHYLVSVRLQEADSLIQPGVLGRVKIEAAPQTGWWRLHRYLATTFNWGL